MSDEHDKLLAEVMKVIDWDREEDEALWERALATRARRFRWKRRVLLGAGIAAVFALAVVPIGITERGERSGSMRTVRPHASSQWGRVPLFADGFRPDMDTAVEKSTPISRFYDTSSSETVMSSDVVESDREPLTQPTTASRSITRAASVHLVVQDVADAIERAKALVDPALGEFVETAAFSGERATSTIVLRIRQERLEAVIAEVGAIGVVASEQISARDVTEQLVDVKARIRNEQRIEQELLELLDQRDDAPLKDVIEVRRELASVRARIERHQASLANIENLVALSRVTVLLQPEGASRESSKSHGMGSYFGRSFTNAWKDGLVGLADTLGTILKWIVSGIVWWIVLGAIVVFAVRVARKRDWLTDPITSEV